MLKLDVFTKEETNILKSKVYLSDLQEQIWEMRAKEMSIVQMAMALGYSESKISKEISKINKKIAKII